MVIIKKVDRENKIFYITGQRINERKICIFQKCMDFFVSYSGYKIHLENPGLTFGIIFGVLLAVIFATLKKAENRYFDRQTSTSLKGIAILFIVFGHFFTICLDQQTFNLGAFWQGVILFLFIAGYGLYQKYQLSTDRQAFWKNRILKLYPSLWITLILFIALDYFLLNVKHSIPEILFNFLGGHVTDAFGSVNSPAWFVEFIMVLYFIFWVTTKLPFSENIKLIALFVLCFLLSAIIYKTPIRNYHGIWTFYTIVFPAGVIFGKYHSVIVDFLKRHVKHQIILWIPIFISLFVFFRWDALIPLNKIIIMLRPLFFIIPAVLLLMIWEKMNYQSKFLEFLGKYSFEIFLLHYPFMVKYDFILFREPLYISFFVYFIFILMLSYGLSRISPLINKGLVSLKIIK